MVIMNMIFNYFEEKNLKLLILVVKKNIHWNSLIKQYPLVDKLSNQIASKVNFKVN